MTSSLDEQFGIILLVSIPLVIVNGILVATFLISDRLDIRTDINLDEYKGGPIRQVLIRTLYVWQMVVSIVYLGFICSLVLYALAHLPPEALSATRDNGSLKDLVSFSSNIAFAVDPFVSSVLAPFRVMLFGDDNIKFSVFWSRFTEFVGLDNLLFYVYLVIIVTWFGSTFIMSEKKTFRQEIVDALWEFGKIVAILLLVALIVWEVLLAFSSPKYWQKFQIGDVLFGYIILWFVYYLIFYLVPYGTIVLVGKLLHLRYASVFKEYAALVSFIIVYGLVMLSFSGNCTYNSVDSWFQAFLFGKSGQTVLPSILLDVVAPPLLLLPPFEVSYLFGNPCNTTSILNVITSMASFPEHPVAVSNMFWHFESVLRDAGATEQVSALIAVATPLAFVLGLIASVLQIYEFIAGKIRQKESKAH